MTHVHLPTAEFQTFVAQWRATVEEALKITGEQVRGGPCCRAPGYRR